MEMNRMPASKRVKRILSYIFLILVGLLMIYPIIWLFFATFKTNAEIFTATKILPDSFDFSGYVNGWKGTGQFGYDTFFLNTFTLVVPTVVFTLISSSIVAYGFARFHFPFKKLAFIVLIATLMLPNSVIIIPRYTLFNLFGWLNTYLPFWMPALFGCYPFFIYMLIQFFRGLPKELDESAYIDGCSTFRTFVSILLPLMKPALFSAALFQFMWTWNDFFNPLLYINSVNKYPLSLALRSSLDIGANVAWNQVLAMALLSVMPLIILFFCAQKSFIEGIATTGLKG